MKIEKMDGEYLPKDTLCSAVFSRVVSLSSDWILDIVGGSADGSDRALFSSFVQDFFWEDTSSSTIDFLFNGHSSRGNTKIKDHKISMRKAIKKIMQGYLINDIFQSFFGGLTFT